MSQSVLERISDRTTSQADLMSEISKLEGVTEPASFWVDIANDPTYPAMHRVLAICQFFKRHVRVPIKVVDLATRLNRPDWINSGSVTRVDHLKGEIPVEWNLGETVLGIRPFGRGAEGLPVLYLRLCQPLDAETFVGIVKGLPYDDMAVGVSVLEAACSGFTVATR